MKSAHRSDSNLSNGPLGVNAVHICVDMQRLFAECTEWQMPWLRQVLPRIVEIVELNPTRTLFTRFLPARKAGHGVGMWRKYYERWRSMTMEELGPDMVALVPELAAYVPPAKVFDKYVYSPWLGSNLHETLREAEVDTVVITGGETDVCVLATALGAIDWGFRTVLVTDALCSSSDATHDALMTFYQGRLNQQLETATTEDILNTWRP
jgi:nicotinamidase-related amidase